MLTQYTSSILRVASPASDNSATAKKQGSRASSIENPAKTQCAPQAQAQAQAQAKNGHAKQRSDALTKYYNSVAKLDVKSSNARNVYKTFLSIKGEPKQTPPLLSARLAHRPSYAGAKPSASVYIGTIKKNSHSKDSKKSLEGTIGSLMATPKSARDMKTYNAKLYDKLKKITTVPQKVITQGKVNVAAKVSDQLKCMKIKLRQLLNTFVKKEKVIMEENKKLKTELEKARLVLAKHNLTCN